MQILIGLTKNEYGGIKAMKKHVFALLGIVLLVISTVFLSCVPSKSSAQTTPTDGIAYKSDLKDYVSKDDVKDNIAGYLADHPQTGGLTESQVKVLIDKALADYAKKSYVDSKVQDLKDDQGWITTATYTTPAGTTTGEYGELMDSDGDLELWLERVSGDATDTWLTKDGTTDARFDLVIMNKDVSSSHDFRINFAFYPDASAEISGDCSASANEGLTFSCSARTGASTSPLNVYQDIDGRILKGDEKTYTVVVEFTQITAEWIDWEYKISIDDRD